MKYYHATTEENAYSIVEDKKINVSPIDGVVYLCKAPEDCCKFLALRGIKEIIVFEVELNEADVEESFDHNKNFFRCSAYMYDKDIPITDETEVWKYTIN